MLISVHDFVVAMAQNYKILTFCMLSKSLIYVQCIYCGLFSHLYNIQYFTEI